MQRSALQHPAMVVGVVVSILLSAAVSTSFIASRCSSVAPIAVRRARLALRCRLIAARTGSVWRRCSAGTAAATGVRANASMRLDPRQSRHFGEPIENPCGRLQSIREGAPMYIFDFITQEEI